MYTVSREGGSSIKYPPTHHYCFSLLQKAPTQLTPCGKSAWCLVTE